MAGLCQQLMNSVFGSKCVCIFLTVMREIAMFMSSFHWLCVTVGGLMQLSVCVSYFLSLTFCCDAEDPSLSQTPPRVSRPEIPAF